MTRTLGATVAALLILAAVYFISPEMRYGSVIIPQAAPGANSPVALTPYSNDYIPLWEGVYELLPLEDSAKERLISPKLISTFALCIIAISLATLLSGSLLEISLITGGILVTLELLFGIDVVHLWPLALCLSIAACVRWHKDSSHVALQYLSLAVIISVVIEFGCIHPGLLLLAILSTLPLINELHPAARKSIFISGAVTVLVLYAITSGDLLLPYPPEAHLVPDDGLAGHVYPLTSSSSSVPLINRPHLKELFLIPGGIIACIGILMGLIAPLAKRRAAILLIGLSTVFLLDLLPEQYAVVAPLQTIRRVIPGLFYFSLTGICLAFIIVLGAIVLHERRRYVFVSIALLATLIFPEPSIVLGKLTSKKSSTLLQEAANLPPKDQRKILSPSFYLYQHYNLLPAQLAVTPEKRTPLRRFEGVTITTAEGVEPQGVRRLKDGNVKTRLAIAKGGQKGGEFLCIEFPEPPALKSISLLTGEFATDFPRGVEIFTSNSSCEELVASQENSSPAARYSPWEGPTLTTDDEDKLAFFGRQSDVVLRVPSDPAVRSYLIKQTLTSPFDWSVAEIRVAQ